jgi:hypothetical protein
MQCQCHSLKKKFGALNIHSFHLPIGRNGKAQRNFGNHQLDSWGTLWTVVSRHPEFLLKKKTPFIFIE